jgi:hypothetical protein
VPLTGNAHGAFGTSWLSSVWVLNTGLLPLTLEHPVQPCPIPCPPNESYLQPGEAGWLPIEPAASPGNGRVLFVRSGSIDDLRGVSRFGTNRRLPASLWTGQVPLIRESLFLENSAVFVDLPNPSLRRWNVRIYTFGESAFFLLRVRSGQSGRLILERTVSLAASNDPFRPAEASVTEWSVDDPAVPAGTENFVLEVVSLTPTSFWTFVSVTDNVTQDVVVYLPNT